MKRLLLSTAATIPFVLASLVYAQTTTAPATETPAPEAPAKMPDTAPDTTPPMTAPDTTAAPMTAPAPMATPPETSKATETVRGWSVKDKILGESVYNENDEKIGDVTDVVLTPNGQASHFVIGAGGFLGMGKHDVAIPFNEIQRSEDRLTLRGYTKDQLKALPKVELAE